jgi:hypothetical protein
MVLLVLVVRRHAKEQSHVQLTEEERQTLNAIKHTETGGSAANLRHLDLPSLFFSPLKVLVLFGTLIHSYRELRREGTSPTQAIAWIVVPIVALGALVWTVVALLI